MKKLDMGQTITILANIGVIVGIVFLAVEVRQNNQLLSAEASQRFVEQRAGALARWADDSGGLMNLRLKATTSQSLTQEEQWRLETEAGFVFTQWEWEYQQEQAGRGTYVPVEAYRAILTRWPWLIELWRNEHRSRFSPDFAQFLDEQVESLDTDVD